MRDFAQKKNRSVAQLIMNPTSETSFGFSSVLATDAWIRFSGEVLDTFGNNAKRALGAFWAYHFISLSSIRGKKCSSRHFTSVPDTAKIVRMSE